MQTTLIIKTLNKGQVTIPAKLRKKLGIKKDDYLKAYTSGKKLILEPASFEIGMEKYVRSFSSKQIRKWLELDKLDVNTRNKARKLFK